MCLKIKLKELYKNTIKTKTVLCFQSMHFYFLRQSAVKFLNCVHFYFFQTKVRHKNLMRGFFFFYCQTNQSTNISKHQIIGLYFHDWPQVIRLYKYLPFLLSANKLTKERFLLVAPISVNVCER